MSPRPRTMDDAALVQACLDGDGAAWRELVSRFSRLVLAVPRRYGLREQDADDVFQAVFAALLEQLPTLRNHRGLAKWLLTTAHRATCRHVHRRGRTLSLEGAELGADEPPPVDLVLRLEQQQTVRLALRRLGGRCERLLTALYLLGEPPGYDELAMRLGMPRGSIGPTRARCLAKLADLLEGEIA